MSRDLAIAVVSCVLMGQGFGCSQPNPTPEEARPEEDALTQPVPRPDLLWSFDLSDAATDRMAVEDLWRIGVECLLWPAAMPEGTDKAAVLERLMQAKYRYVGDFEEEDDL